MAKKDVTKKEQVEVKNEIVENLKEQVLYDLDKAIKANIKNNIEEYKQEMKKELINDVNDEINLAVKREEKRFIRSKNIALLKKNLIILILIAIIGYFGYCLYDVKYFKFMQTPCVGDSCNVNQNNNVEVTNPEPNEVIKDDKWYLDNYSYLLKTAHINLNADNINSYYLYSKDHDIDDLRMSYLLNMAYNNLAEEDIKTSTSSITINNDALKNAFQKTFYNLEYVPSNFSYNCLNFVYNENRNRYTAENTKCEVSANEIIENIDKIYEKEEDIIIETYATLYNNDEKSCYSFDDLFNPILINIEKDQIWENSKKLNKYQYTYELIDNNYYLKSISKMK